MLSATVAAAVRVSAALELTLRTPRTMSVDEYPIKMVGLASNKVSSSSRVSNRGSRTYLGYGWMAGPGAANIGHDEVGRGVR